MRCWVFFKSPFSHGGRVNPQGFPAGGKGESAGAPWVGEGVRKWQQPQKQQENELGPKHEREYSRRREKPHPSSCLGRRENWWGMWHLVCAIIAAWRAPVLAIGQPMPAVGSCPAQRGMQPWGWQDLSPPGQDLGSQCLRWSEPSFHFGERRSSD